MSGIKINSGFGLTGLATTKTIREEILENPSVVHWFRSDDTVALVGSGVAMITDLTGSGATLAQANVDRQPTFTETEFGKYPGMVFGGVSDRMIGDTVFNAEGPFTMVVIGSCTDASGGTQAAFTVRNDATNQSALLFNSDELRFQTGNTFTGVAYTSGDIFCAICSVNGTTRKLAVNGVRQSNEAMASGAGANAAPVMGSLADVSSGAFGGAIHDVILFSDDLIEDADFVALINAYAARLGAVI